MTHIRAMTIFSRDTGDQADSQTNTLYFDTDDLTSKEQEGADVNSLLALFYQAIDVHMPQAFFTPTAEVKVYDMADSEPRVPFHEGTIALTLGAATPQLPPEVSCVLSFHGEFESGINKARRRGRIFLPTFIELTTVLSGRLEWNALQLGDVTTAATALMNNSVAGMNWAVFSPTTLAQTGNLDIAFNDVVGGWADTDPDIQRRRGPDAARSRIDWPPP